MAKSNKLEKQRRLSLTLIVLLAIILRFFKLNDIPQGLAWDEAAIVYNAWSIAEYGIDEHGTRYPLSFESFGDYKAPLVIYLLSGIYKVIGLQIEMVRVVPALAGVVSVLLIYGIAKEIFDKEPIIWLVSALTLAVSPWAINLSRVGFEANTGLVLVLMACWLLLKAEGKVDLIWFSATAFGLSMYTYHSTKIFVPLLLFGYVLLRKKVVLTNKGKYLAAAGLLLFLSVPMIYSSIWGEAGKRASTLIVFDDLGESRRSIAEVGVKLGKNIASQLSPSFWVKGKDAVGLRHLVPGNGAIYRVEFLFFVLGFMVVINKRNNKFNFIVWWLLVGLLPSILSIQSPHAIRSLVSLPAVEMVVAVGFMVAWKYLNRESRKLGIMFLVLVGGWMILNLDSYLSNYYGDYANNSSGEFQYGYKEAFEIVDKIGRKKDKIVVTSTYGHPYIYTLLYQQIGSKDFISGGLANYEFRSIDWSEKKLDTLYVGTAGEIDPDSEEVVEKIYSPDGDDIVFVIAETEED